ncbi:MAG: hypothetical protein WDW38_007325 [Sanguina aurantia]
MCALHSRTSRPGQTGVLPATTADLPGNDGGARRWPRKRRLWRARSEGKATQRHLTGKCVPSTREQAGRDKQACSRRPPRTCPATTAVRAGGHASGDAASTADTTTRAAYPSSHVAHLQRRRTSGGRRRTCPATTAVRAGGHASGDAASTADTTTRAAYPSSHVAHLQRRRTSGGRRRPAVEGAQRGQGYPTAPDRQMCALHSRTSRPGQTGVLPATTADLPGNDGGARRWPRKRRLWRARSEGKATQRHLTGKCVPSTREQAGRDKQACSRRPPRTCPATTAVRAGGHASGDAASTADTTTRAAYPSSHVAHLQRRRTSGGRRRVRHRRLWRARSEGKATQRHLTGKCVPSTREQAGRDKQACSRRPPRTCPATTAVRAGGHASGDAASTADTTTRAAYPSSHVAHLQRRRTSGGRRRPAVEGVQRGQGYPTAPDRQMCALHSRTSRPGQTGVLPATTADVPGNDGGARRWPRKRRLWRARSEGKATQRHLTGRCVPSTREQAGRDKQACSRRPPRTCPATTAVRAGGHASGDAASTADTTTRAAYPSSHVAHLQRRRTSGGRRRPAVEGVQRGQGYPTAPDRQMCALHSRTSRPGQTGVLPATTADLPGNDGGARRWPRKRRLWRARSEGKATQRHLTGRCVPSTREQAGRDKQACSRRPPRTCPATTAVRAGGDASGDAASTADTTTRAAYPSSHVAHLQRRRTSGGRRRPAVEGARRGQGSPTATGLQMCALHSQTSRPGKTGMPPTTTADKPGNDGGREKQACPRQPPRTSPATTAVCAGGDASGGAANTADTTTRTASRSSHVAHLQRHRTSGGRRRPAVEGARRGQGSPTATGLQMCALHSQTSRPGKTGMPPTTTADKPGNDGGREKQACPRQPPRTSPATTAVCAGGDASGGAANTADTTTRTASRSSHVAHLQRHRTSGGRRRPAVEGARRGQGSPTATGLQMCALHSQTSRPGKTGMPPTTTADKPGNDGGVRRWRRKRPGKTGMPPTTTADKPGNDGGVRRWRRKRWRGKHSRHDHTDSLPKQPCCSPAEASHLRRATEGREKQACPRQPPRTSPATTAVCAGGDASGGAANTADTTTRTASRSSHVAHLQRHRTSGGRRRPAVEGARRGQGSPTATGLQMCALHSQTSRPGKTGMPPTTTADKPGNDGGREKQACPRQPPRTSPATTAVCAGGDASGGAANTADTTTRTASRSSHVAHLQRHRTSGGRRRVRHRCHILEPSTADTSFPAACSPC